jgi:DNA-binding protein HU-beta
MNKGELISAIAEKTEQTQAQSKAMLEAVLSTIKEALAEDDAVQLIGFGTFSVKERAEREGRNPQTGEPLTIAAKKVVSFKPGKEFTECVNPKPSPKAPAKKKKK